MDHGEAIAVFARLRDRIKAVQAGASATRYDVTVRDGKTQGVSLSESPRETARWAVLTCEELQRVAEAAQVLAEDGPAAARMFNAVRARAEAEIAARDLKGPPP